jgi:hypothetical protein
MENSSNEEMNQVFEKLSNIKQVEPGSNLYHKTINKLRKQNNISLFWVRAVACVLIAFLSAEFFIVSIKNQTNKKDISILIYKTNHILYNE